MINAMDDRKINRPERKPAFGFHAALFTILCVVYLYVTFEISKSRPVDWYLHVFIFAYTALIIFVRWKGEQDVASVAPMIGRQRCPFCAIEIGLNAAGKARFGPGYDEGLTDEPTRLWRVECPKCGSESDFDKDEQRLHVKAGGQPQEVDLGATGSGKPQF